MHLKGESADIEKVDNFNDIKVGQDLSFLLLCLWRREEGRSLTLEDWCLPNLLTSKPAAVF